MCCSLGKVDDNLLVRVRAAVAYSPVSAADTLALLLACMQRHMPLFHPVTGELLPEYRDAYLRGTLSKTNTARVEAYLVTHKDQATKLLSRLTELQAGTRPVQPVGWVQRQLFLVYTDPWRFTYRLLLLLISGMVLLTLMANLISAN